MTKGTLIQASKNGTTSRLFRWQRRIAVAASVLAIVLVANRRPAHGQVSLFDNLDNVRFDDDWVDALGPDRRFAQQFLMGNQSTLDRVTLKLQRTGTAPTGSLGVELWQDSGSNEPPPVGDASAKIADIGTLADVTQLPVGSFDDVVFSDLGLGLSPNTPYWIVLNYSDVSGLAEPGNSVGWGVALAPHFSPDTPNPPEYDANAGTGGAAFAHLYRDADPDWISAATAFGADAVYFSLGIQAVPEPSACVILAIGAGLFAFRFRQARRSCRAKKSLG